MTEQPEACPPEVCLRCSSPRVSAPSTEVVLYSCGSTWDRDQGFGESTWCVRAHNRRLLGQLFAQSRELAELRKDAERWSPKWRTTPPVENGWYFMAEKPDEYDLAKPVGVRRIEDSDGVRFEINGWYSGKAYRNVTDFPNAVWFGPFRTVGKPPAIAQSTEEK